MFSQSKGNSPFSLGLPGGGGQPKANAKSKPLSPEEKYQQALVTANMFLASQRARLTREMDRYTAVENSNYWFYGYFGANMVATMAACLTLGNRVPFFRAYSGWIALAGGYFGSKACIGLHKSYLLTGVVSEINQGMAGAQRMDEQTGHLIPDYQEEVERLKTIKYQLMPALPEAKEAIAKQKDWSLDDHADALVEAYTKRKEALSKK